MNIENYDLKSETSRKIGLSTFKIPILKIPKSEDEFIYLDFDEESKAINCNYINTDGILQKFLIENYPIEKCKKCQCELTVNNLNFLESNSTIELFCDNCCQNKESISALSFFEKNLFTNNQLIIKLKSYLNNYNDLKIPFYKKTMDGLISFTNIIIILIELFKSKSAFKIPVKFMENYIKNINLYLEIVDNIKMKNLYLFFKNFMIVSTIKINNNFLNKFLDHYLNRIYKFNITEIQLFILKKLFNKEGIIYFILIEETLERKKNSLEINNVLELNDDLSLLRDIYNEKKISWLKEKIKIMELKTNIINFLRDYNDSYNYISTKKVLERKIINEIIFVLFKYHHEKFQKIKGNEYILSSIEKELQNIIRFLDDSSNTKTISLKKKIKEQINYFKKQRESKSDEIKSNSSKNLSNYTLKNKEISLTKDEKELLKDYLSTTTEDSYTLINASKETNPEAINYRKIQVILEFLFFIRDKTISIIHLFNNASTLFFNFLYQFSPDKKIKEKETNVIYEIKNIQNNNDKDYYNIDELKKDFDFKFSKEHKTQKENIFKSLEIEPINDIDCLSALKYIFSDKINNDYMKEINYLYNNIVLPERNKQEEPIKEKEIESDYFLFQKRIDTEYNKLEDKFKNDPLFNSIIAYFNDSAKKINKNENIQFYEDHVDNFCSFKRMFTIKKNVKEYIKLIESEELKLKKLKLVSEKYMYIQKEIKNYLNSNEKNYQLYYEEWKTKNKKFVVENYELKDLINDLNKLIPKEANIKITNKEKRNFSLILYLFQTGYFLKDYI